MDEEVLAGGVANAGAVTRVGDFVLRPSNPHTGSIHRFLTALRTAGFEGASLPVGVDGDGRERLWFIDGDVPLPPYPAWAQTDTALASIATLMRRFHDADRSFDPVGCTWSEEIADPAGGPIVCHNDVCLENVVLRDGIAVGLLDHPGGTWSEPTVIRHHTMRAITAAGFTAATAKPSGMTVTEVSKATLASETSTVDFRKGKETRVLKFVLEPGGTTGWHRHPQHSLFLVDKGTLTSYGLDGPPCEPVEFTAGRALSAGPHSHHAHLVRNVGRDRLK